MKLPLCLLLTMSLPWLSAQEKPAPAELQPVLIVHPKVKQSTVRSAEVKAIFLGTQTRWSDKTRLTPLTLKSGKLHEAFLKKYVKKTSSQFRTYWRKQVFTGKGRAPKSYANEKQLIAQVAKTPGSVAYVSAASAEKIGRSVRILEVKDPKSSSPDDRE